MSTLEDVLEYASWGWHCFPVDRISKVPCGGHGHKDGTTNPEQLRAWFDCDDPPNVGLWLRQSGLIAVDVDPRNGGDVSFAALEAAHGALPRECSAKSGGNGLHVIMKDPGGRVRGKLGKGIDVKCNGYVLVQPSRGSGGGTYEWLALDPHNVPAVPDAWRALIVKPDTVGQLANTDGLQEWEESSDPGSFRDEAKLHEKLAALGDRKNGNSTTYRAIRLVFHDFGLSIAEGWQHLAWWNAQCGAPHSQDELERRVWGAAEIADDPRFGQRGQSRSDVASLDKIARAAVLTDEATGAAIAPVVAPTALGSILAPPAATPAVPANLTAYQTVLVQAATDVDAYLGSTTNVEAERPYFEPAGGLFSCSYPPTPWRVRGLMVEGGIAAIATEPKSAKTWLATEIAIAVATGTPVCGEFETRACTVVYFYTEDLKESIRNRLRALAAGRGMTPESAVRNLHVQPRGRAIDLSDDADCARVIASCRMIGNVGLLVLDPLRNIHSKKENEADDMAQVFKRARMIGEMLGCTVLIVHHAAKASENTKGRRPGQRMRGSGAIHGFIDSGIYLEDLRGDGVSTFINTVRSEVKAARSAGSFELTLKIDDDKEGTAIKATWSKNDATQATPDKIEALEDTTFSILDAMLVGEMRRSPLRTTKQIREQSKCRAQALFAALAIAVTRGWLSKNRTGNYALTDTGRELAKDRLGEQPTIDTTKHATGAIAGMMRTVPTL